MTPVLTRTLDHFFAAILQRGWENKPLLVRVDAFFEVYTLHRLPVVMAALHTNTISFCAVYPQSHPYFLYEVTYVKPSIPP